MKVELGAATLSKHEMLHTDRTEGVVRVDGNSWRMDKNWLVREEESTWIKE